MAAASGRTRHRQHGTATLLVALVLMMAVTTLTLAVARTGLFEQNIATNDYWYMRLSLHAAAALAQVQPLLLQDLDTLTWQTGADDDTQVSYFPGNGDDPQIESELTLQRARDAQDFILIESSAQRRDGSGLTVRVSSWTRRLSLLTPLSETAPPLVLGGCVQGEAFDFQIRPLGADSGAAGDALWTSAQRSCAPIMALDSHRGTLLARSFHDDLWSDLFSVDREGFAALVAQDAGQPVSQRIYYIVQAADLNAGRWTTSLGGPSRHVALVFPPELGCPEFAPGVQIYGLVFIDADCSTPITGEQLEIYGTLVINGDFDVTDSGLYLNHISLAEPRDTQLRLPVLRNIPVPGTWRDF